MELPQRLLRELQSHWNDEAVVDFERLKERIREITPDIDNIDYNRLRRDTDAAMHKLQRLFTSCAAYASAQEDDDETTTFAERLIGNNDENANAERTTNQTTYQSPPVVSPPAHTPSDLPSPSPAEHRQVWAPNLKTCQIRQATIIPPSPSYTGRDDAGDIPIQTCASAELAKEGSAGLIHAAAEEIGHVDVDEGADNTSVDIEENDRLSKEVAGKVTCLSPWDAECEVRSECGDESAADPCALGVDALLSEAAQLEEEGRLVEASKLMARALASSQG